MTQTIGRASLGSLLYRGWQSERRRDTDDKERRLSSRTRGIQASLRSRLLASWFRILWQVFNIWINACMVHAVMMMKPIQLSWHASLHLSYVTTSRCLRRSRYARASLLMISTQIYSVEDQAIWQSILGKWLLRLPRISSSTPHLLVET